MTSPDRPVGDYKAILHGLLVAMLDIRASRDSSQQSLLADIFHHVPTMMSEGREPSEIVEDILVIARRRGCEGAIAKLFD